MEPTQKANGGSSASAYSELRRLLLGPERAEITTLKERVEAGLTPEDVSRALPEAIRLSTSRDMALQYATRPLVEEALRVSVRKNPEILVDALFPIIGTAVRKAVGDALNSMAQSINQVMEQSLSWRSLQWRFEALRTGKSYGEIVLFRSLLYRVEQVFLIHKETGLLLQQRVATSVVIRDPDLVSGMLTAIQDFVRDSFGNQPNQELETLRVGDLDVWIQYSPHAILAAVIRGTPPRALASVFASTLEQICRKKGAELEKFDGDTAPFASCQEDLKACFLGQAEGKKRGLSPVVVWGAVLGLLALLTWAGLSFVASLRWDRFMERVRSQPGTVVTSVEKEGGVHTVSGMRDPLAEDPARLLAGTGIDPATVKFHWELYHSLQPAFETPRRLLNEKAFIEGQTLHFAAEDARLSPEAGVRADELARHILALIETGKQLGRSVNVEIIGHSDDVGTDEINTKLSFDRADQVRAVVTGAGVPANLVSTRGAGNLSPMRRGNSEQDRWFNRVVSFRVQLGSK